MISFSIPAPPRSGAIASLAAAGLICVALLGCDPGDRLEAIRAQHASGNYAGSIEPLRALLAERPDDAEANYLYGRALVFTQRPGLASFSLRNAMKDPEWLVPAATQLAFSALDSSDFNEVVEVTGRILEREPENVSALLMRANAYAHWKNDPERALADANRVLELSPDTIEAFEPRILALLSLERHDEVGEALAEAGRRMAELGSQEETLAWHCATTAIYEQESGEVERAREAWIRCLDAYPTNQDVIVNAMGFYDAQGEGERSLEIVRGALAGAPNSRAFRLTLAERLRVRGDVAEAESVLREATRSDDPRIAAAAWADLGKVRQTLGEHGAAADAMRRAVELAQEAGAPNAQLEFVYADSLVLAGRYARALEVAEDLSVPAYRHMIRARVAQGRGDPARALEEFDAALLLWPDNPWARYYAAVAAEALGDFERAVAEYRYAIRIAPEATDARTRAATLLAAEGKPRLGLELLRVAPMQAPLEIQGQLLFTRLSALMGDMAGVSFSIRRLAQKAPRWVGPAVAQAAEGLSKRAGPAPALRLLETAPWVDFDEPHHGAALRARVRLAHEAGDLGSTRAALESALAAHPDASAFQEIRGLDLELSGAPIAEARAAYTRALELGPGNARALAGLGRLAMRDDLEAAVAFFDRAVAADPFEPEPKLQAARALAAIGKPDEAAEKLDALLREHPFEPEAAAERARLDLERGIATPRTLELARRALRFGGGPENLELLSLVHAQRGEPEEAARAAERARALRESRASDA